MVNRKKENDNSVTEPEGSNRVPIPHFVYSSEYDMDLGPHVFPSVKFGFVYQKLIEHPGFKLHKFHEPEPVSKGMALFVHDKTYINDLLQLKTGPRITRSELPLNRPIVDAFFLATGGTLLAARLALEYGSGFNLSGGFHHAFRDHAEGFCYLNDVAIAIRCLQKEKKIKKALIIDLDVHQGNGSAHIFRRDSSVFTFSMHEQNNYPVKEKGSLDIGLDSGIHDEEFLSILGNALSEIRKRFSPDLIFYLAGVDSYEDDLLGGFRLTGDGIAERDRMVRDFIPGLPLATVLAGGYATNFQNTVDLHLQTCEILAGLK